MARGNLICSAGSRAQLEQMINQWYFSENYIIVSSGNTHRAYNKKTGEFSSMIVKEVKGRWRFETPE